MAPTAMGLSALLARQTQYMSGGKKHCCLFVSTGADKEAKRWPCPLSDQKKSSRVMKTKKKDSSSNTAVQNKNTTKATSVAAIHGHTYSACKGNTKPRPV